ncbi:hypothetical protein [Altererythrobacter sp. MTPC7]|uniref:hypothetical protein n=1 Tax=Altererythrobacter sp. MTPC7 TaxID=3056567 RepID=UPI0036F37AC3
MSRRSIDSRMDRIVDRLLPPGSMARREYRLPDAMKAALAIHRQESARIIARFEKPGSWYEAHLENDPTAAIPEMPRQLREALGLVDPPVITDRHTDNDAAAAWDRFREGDR